MGSRGRFAGAIAGLALGVILGAPRVARADASAWLAVGGGLAHWKSADVPYTDQGLLNFDGGVGTTPDGIVIVGGLFRVAPVLGSGTDLALLGRIATHGFQSGAFGAALDLGGYFRTWGQESQGFAGGLTLGAPLGLQLSFQTLIGNEKTLSFAGVLGVDLLRLTVYRQNMLDWWPNPKPAQLRTEARAR